MRLTVYTHPDCIAHDPGPGHPESPARLQRILNDLDTGYLAGELDIREAPPATEETVSLAHSTQLIDELKQALPETGQVAVDADTILSPESWQAALRATGAVCTAVDALMADDTDAAFCATRPPGHHATRDVAMGFCLINHVAIAALYAQNRYRLERVAIVDFDVHHGNGSQDILKNRPGVLYISTHQSPLYPGTGSTAENIPGNILNVPLPSSITGDEYREIFSSSVLPALAEFRPQLLLVSAGFDAHADDPLASLALHEEDYQWLGAQLKDVANGHASGRLAAVLEGGYNLDALGSSVTAFLDGLLQNTV